MGLAAAWYAAQRGGHFQRGWLGGAFACMVDKSVVDGLKNSIQSLWQMENQLRYSAWSAFALDKEKAREHLAEARRHLNNLLNTVPKF